MTGAVRAVGKGEHRGDDPFEIPDSHRLLLRERDQVIAWRALRMEQRMCGKHAVFKAIADLSQQVALPRGPKVGVVLASEPGNRSVVLDVADDLRAAFASGNAEDGTIMQCLANFVPGRILKAAADVYNLRGPQVPVEGSFEDAQVLGERLLAAGRVEQVVVAWVRVIEGAALALACLLEKKARPSIPSPPCAVLAAATPGPSPGMSVLDLAVAAVKACPDPGGRGDAVLIFGSLFGDLPERCLAQILGRQEPSSVQDQLEALARFAGCGRYLTVQGAAGASMCALALGQDLIALGEAQRVLVLAVDRVDGAVDKSLRLLSCEDRPFLRNAAAAVWLGEAEGKGQRLDCRLFSPAWRRHRVVLGYDQGPQFAAPSPDQVEVAGILEADLASGLAWSRWSWPESAVERLHEDRKAGAAAACFVAQEHRRADRAVRAQVGLHLLGGSGVVVSSWSGGGTERTQN